MASCTVDPYESGDTSLSYLKAEMVDMHVVDGRIMDTVTDADEQIAIPASYTVSGFAEKGDTTYRAMLYYNKEDVGEVTVKGIKLAHVLRPSASDRALTLATDPVKLVSAWRADNGSYVNLSLGLMVGNADDDDAIHKLSLVLENVESGGHGSKTYNLTLHHDQDSIPEYYTQTVYVSIPLRDYASGDRICIRVNTYSGMVEKEFVR